MSWDSPRSVPPPGETAPLPREELRNPPVSLPPGVSSKQLTDDLLVDDKPRRVSVGPASGSGPISGTMVGLLSPEPPAGAGDSTRLAPEGELARPSRSAPPANPAADLPGFEKSDPGFSQAPSFDHPSPAGSVDLRGPKRLPPLGDTAALPIPIAREPTAELVEMSGVPQPAGIELRLKVAGNVRRLGAFLIDAALFSVAIQAIAWTGALGEAWVDIPYTPDNIALAVQKSGFILPVAAIAILLLVGSSAFTALLGRSPGKLVFGIRVVTRKTGQKPGFVRAAIRGVLSVVSVGLAGAGLFYTIVDRERRTLHDLLTGTTIVRA
jgi:uncharacterized RDD family membrane protein YckC